ncbi:GNAT family acetyltransferase [Elizabethkingia miricola]|uniref:GNAT family acetyltransferase n=1 Tax=Elizabethkingia miricola TaxID=172045 RepID=A0AAQ1PI41_ELIMR|nr:MULTISPECIES: GNAT family N-acetyltransferase [Elizabethkingia]KUY15741.1 GNAT family acetyltransferase [Elizabethkingia miricola]MCL1652155.1 GNAT family N-acetyltransferase [Elizabethkingia miricola]OPC40476.1 GNAT family acetyltransferase [Elizabethkingia miricola]OPC69303.1 GNAT family acetyltransferase [Elizabethkingia miricola]OPC71841.1 GNAT family acetyltransferase [Elizabethkingia miricola]
MEVPLKIETERLILSPLKESDIPLITEYLQEKIISDNTSHIPYPYSESDARTWIKMSDDALIAKTGYTFAIREKEGKIIGAIGLHDRGDDKAELGYWIAVPFWNKGYATEAASAILNFGIKELKFHKIYATHFIHNPASGKIMGKIGMQKEAVLKHHIKKEGQYLDIQMYSFIV